MKLPKTFLPENDLENKVKNLLKSDKPVKKAEEQRDYKKRQIWIYFRRYPVSLDNDIHVLVKQPKEKKGYSLNIKSLDKFFHPISGYDTVPALLGNTKVKAYVRSQGMLHDYLNSLKNLNNSEIIWANDKGIQKLKRNYNAWQSFVKHVMYNDENT